jgi:hypothetical protein
MGKDLASEAEIEAASAGGLCLLLAEEALVCGFCFTKGCLAACQVNYGFALRHYLSSTSFLTLIPAIRNDS